MERISQIPFKKQKMVVNTSNYNFNSLRGYDCFFPNITCFSLCLHAFLMNEIPKKHNKFYGLFLFLISLLLCFVVCCLCYFVAEKYFFDKFFYYKSVKHGYWVDKTLNLQNFDDRAKDLISLFQDDSQILGISDNHNYFKIAIFGDSFVWGQGVTNNQRFPVLLEKDLNKIRPTKIYSFGGCGDNIFDNYVKYQLSQKIFGKMDLYIFALYNNDLVFNDDNRYDTNQFLSKLNVGCSGNTIFDPTFSGIPNADFNTPRKLSFNEETINYCAYKRLLLLLPKEKTIYINLSNMTEKWEVQTIFSQIIKSDLNVLEPKYETLCDNKKTCYISEKDRHPSPLIHKFYSDILFKEITTNPKFNFKIGTHQF